MTQPSAAESGATVAGRLELGKDVCIEILSNLDLIESNQLAHVNHGWHQASQVERRRVVELTLKMLYKLEQKYMNESTFRTTLISSPLARLITRVPDWGAITFHDQETITTAAKHFPNLLHMLIELSRPNINTTGRAPATTAELEPLTQLFHLAPQLTSIKIDHANYQWSPITCKPQQIYLDSLSTATQLHTIELSGFDQTIDLTVFTQLPLLTVLTISKKTDGPMPPMPDHVLQILSSLRALISLRVGWRVLADQWSQLHLPQLRHIGILDDYTYGVKCSSDLVPLMGTMMVKSLRHLRLRLDSGIGADLTKLMELVKLTQLDELELWRHASEQSKRELTEKDIRDIYAALIQLKSLTSLKMNDIYSSAGKDYRMNVSDLLAHAPHLTALELVGCTWHVIIYHNGPVSSIIDFNFLQSPLAHQRLVDLNMEGYFSRSHMLGEDGLLQCHQLRRLKFRTWIPEANEWWEELKVKLDSRRVLPTLDHLDMTLDDTDDTVEHLMWDRFTGSDPPSFRK